MAFQSSFGSQDSDPGENTDLDPEDDGLDDGDPDDGGEPEPSSRGGKVFWDANQVPDELRPSFREMQANYTRRMQEVAARSADLSKVEHKATILDGLLSDPEFAEFLTEFQTRRNGGGGGRQSSMQTDDSIDPMIAEQVQRALERSLGPQISQLSSKLGSVEDQMTVAREREQFVAAHPDWETYRDGMAEAWEREGSDLSMEAAYRYAVFERLRAQDQSQQRRSAVRRLGGEGSQASQRRTVTRSPKVTNFWEAVDAAISEMNLDPKQYGR